MIFPLVVQPKGCTSVQVKALANWLINLYLKLISLVISSIIIHYLPSCSKRLIQRKWQNSCLPGLAPKKTTPKKIPSFATATMRHSASNFVWLTIIEQAGIFSWLWLTSINYHLLIIYYIYIHMYIYTYIYIYIFICIYVYIYIYWSHICIYIIIYIISVYRGVYLIYYIMSYSIWWPQKLFNSPASPWRGLDLEARRAWCLVRQWWHLQGKQMWGWSWFNHGFETRKLSEFATEMENYMDLVPKSMDWVWFKVVWYWENVGKLPNCKGLKHHLPS